MIWKEAGGIAGNAVPPGQGAFQINAKVIKLIVKYAY